MIKYLFALFINMFYSYSRLDTFSKCGLKYKFTYHDKLEKDFDNTIEGFMGSRVHDSLEHLYKQKKYERTLTVDQLKDHYKKIWSETINDDVKVIRPDLKVKDYYNMGLKYIADYHKKHFPFEEDHTIGMEVKVDVDLFNDDKYVMRGYVDRVGIKDGIYIIHDYKTSGTLPSKDDIENNYQLALYAIALKDKYPDAKDFELVWHYLAFDTEIRIRKKPEDYERIKVYIRNKIDFIEAMNESDFTPKESALCGWCQFASKCPVKKHVLATKQLSLEAFSKDYGANAAKEYLGLMDRRTELNNKISDVEERIFEYAKKNNLQQLYSGDGILRLFMKNSFKLPTKGTPKFQEIKRILKDNDLEDFMTIDAYNLIKSFDIDLIPEDVKKQIIALVEEKEIKRIYPKRS